MDDKKHRGGAREGAGRKATGRQKENFYITEQEKEQLKRYLDAIRSGQPPIETMTIRQEYQKHLAGAVAKQSKSRPSLPQFTQDLYKAQALGMLVGVAEGYTMNQFKAQVEIEKSKQAEEQWQQGQQRQCKWERQYKTKTNPLNQILLNSLLNECR